MTSAELPNAGWYIFARELKPPKLREDDCQCHNRAPGIVWSHVMPKAYPMQTVRLKADVGQAQSDS